ncbi:MULTISPECIES: hypothetical protein [Methylobacterium]|uniref:hypothetical protein n=1 Tax=Methylobacterium TaxID=407 RepID=UPI001113602C|nr:MULTISPECIES: hypothetical protein [Methylobacterium]
MAWISSPRRPQGARGVRQGLNPIDPVNPPDASDPRRSRLRCRAMACAAFRSDCLRRSSSARKIRKTARVGPDGNDQARERAMSHLKLAGFSVAAALALGLGSGAMAAPFGTSRPAVEAAGVADGLILKAQTLGMERRHDRRMDRHERRMDRQVNRQDRRMDRHERRMERRY